MIIILVWVNFPLMLISWEKVKSEKLEVKRGLAKSVFDLLGHMKVKKRMCSLQRFDDYLVILCSPYQHTVKSHVVSTLAPLSFHSLTTVMLYFRSERKEELGCEYLKIDNSNLVKNK